MAYDNITTQQEDAILTITINRPDKLNALNSKTIEEIGKAVDKVYTNPDIKGAIITGAGEKAFAAGADIAEFTDYTKEEAKTMSTNGHKVFNAIENCPKPVIAAVNGFALGGGCELAMACHLRVASDNAKFGQPEVSLGIIPGYGGTQRLVQLIGKGKALELMMTGDILKADDALQAGLVNYVVDQEELLSKCREILNQIFTKAPLAVGKVINSVNALFAEGKDGFATEIEEFSSCMTTEDFKEGTSAFIEKRKAEFKGK